ncbi:efflux RND transporter periplasmic adaptor subunit [Crateriforma conspicua]|uniref:Multidrug resistance protein MdtN n=1 Tax=Crateriforma conspicua TaxID=2527996 RepID=A0A5C5Y7K7_9PLAN|nr:HlyD family efflux transporter periplasmic adaptor subunit [Crateriforma conspicua]TWT71164.1 multidrug resistance protein MdtN [Crateriforma conspicua]
MAPQNVSHTAGRDAATSRDTATWTDVAANAIDQLDVAAQTATKLQPFLDNALGVVVQTVGATRCTLSLLEQGVPRVLASRLASDPSPSETPATTTTTARIRRVDVSPDTALELMAQWPQGHRFAAASQSTMTDVDQQQPVDEFLTSVLQLCQTVFLKDQYARYRTFTPTASPDESSTSSGRKQKIRLATVLIIALGLIGIVPVPFHLPVDGVIRAKNQFGIYAPVSGRIAEVAVTEGQNVKEGQVLLVLENADLQLRRSNVIGELATAEAELTSLRAGSSKASGESDPNQGLRQSVLRTKIDALRKQVELANQIHETLTLRAPITGRVNSDSTWNHRTGQNIAAGQWFMDIVSDDEGYVAVMSLPERQFGYLGDERIPCDFRLRSAPESSLSGTVQTVAETVSVRPDGTSVVEMTIPVDSDIGLRHGAEVVGHITPKRRPLGFVLFRPIIEAFRNQRW